MNKKIMVVVPAVIAVVIIGIFVGGSLVDSSPSQKDNVIFHARLADPALYVDGVYSESLVINAGNYHFRFVPNGSSPEILSISISGNSFEFNENFELKNELQQTGISEYHTWRYDGVESFSVPESGQVKITINPNGNEMGSVTVDILEN